MDAQERLTEFDREELRVWSALATLLEWLPATLDAQLQRDSELSHFDYGVMFALSKAPLSTLRLSDLAEYANSTLSRLSRSITRLEKPGWVVRSIDSEDGRITRATLTVQGHQIVSDATPGHVQLVRSIVFNALTKEQSSQLFSICRGITSAIREGGEWSPDPVPRSSRNRQTSS